MALKAPSSGSNRLFIIGLTTDTVLFTYDKTTQTTIAGDPKRDDVSIQIDSKIRNAALRTHLNTYLSNAVIEKQDIVYEDNSKDTLITGLESAVPFRYVWFNGTADSKVETLAGFGVYSGDTGNATAVANGVGDFPISIQGISQPTGGLLTFGATLLNGLGKVSGVTDMVLLTTEYGRIEFLTASA